jgi:hypothetical protein
VKFSSVFFTSRDKNTSASTPNVIFISSRQTGEHLHNPQILHYSCWCPNTICIASGKGKISSVYPRFTKTANSTISPSTIVFAPWDLGKLSFVLQNQTLSSLFPVPLKLSPSILLLEDLEKAPFHPVTPELWILVIQIQRYPIFIQTVWEKASFAFCVSGTVAACSITLDITYACLEVPEDNYPHIVLHQIVAVPVELNSVDPEDTYPWKPMFTEK